MVVNTLLLFHVNGFAFKTHPKDFHMFLGGNLSKDLKIRRGKVAKGGFERRNLIEKAHILIYQVQEDTVTVLAITLIRNFRFSYKRGNHKICGL